ncbi:CbbBc protein, partial [Ralstonia pseudosolanacearum]
GHSNVQGNRTMGVWDKPSDKLLDQIDKVFGIKSPRAHGYTVVETLEAMQQGKVKVFMSLAGNFAVATPDKARTEAGIRGCELTVQIQTKLNRSHLIHGKEAIILPCLGRTDID